MTHQDAVEQLAVERYLLGELTGAPRGQFEDHLFDCALCAEDLQQGVTFLVAARSELKHAPRPAVVAPRKVPSPLSWGPPAPLPLLPRLPPASPSSSTSPPSCCPAHARSWPSPRSPPCSPRSRSPTPAPAGRRSSRPSTRRATASTCSPSMSRLPPTPPPSAARSWMPPARSSGTSTSRHGRHRDAVTIQVPVMTAQQGVNELHVQGISAQGVANGALTTYKYNLIHSK